MPDGCSRMNTGASLLRRFWHRGFSSLFMRHPVEKNNSKQYTMRFRMELGFLLLRGSIIRPNQHQASHSGHHPTKPEIATCLQASLNVSPAYELKHFSRASQPLCIRSIALARHVVCIHNACPVIPMFLAGAERPANPHRWSPLCGIATASPRQQLMSPPAASDYPAFTRPKPARLTPSPAGPRSPEMPALLARPSPPAVHGST
jgi:hypothetical protein